MKRQEIISRLLEPMEMAFDDKESMIVRDYDHWVGGYHTRRTGKTHVVRDTADYAASVLLLGQKEHYANAVRALYRICELQDLRPGSRTYGLWSYYLEEDLDHMLAPDYNWSDFIGKNLIGVLRLCCEDLPLDLQEKLRTAIRAAMECSIKRNVAADYTNMSIMGGMTIMAAGELLGDSKLSGIGRERLEKLYEYTVFNGAFSEYNSSAYLLVAMNEIMRMLAFFRDERCLFIAGELNRYAWECLAAHYNTSIGQLTPPQARAYRDLDNGSLAWAVWQGTEGRYGRVPEEEEALAGGISLESLCFPPVCPQECLKLFEEKERFLAHTYYRKNDIRSRGEDTTIIRELDSPDLTAFSYLTPEYSMGAWEWPQGVALFAMYQYYKESGDAAMLEFLRGWFDRQLQKGLPEQNINTTCPMLTLACIYEETGEEKYLPVLKEWLENAMHKLPRTEEGGLQHVVSGILNQGQLWDDTLYMTVMFIARMGLILGEERCIQESIRQFLVHIKYLSDNSTGLFFHGWTFEGNHNFAKALWGRGNSWYTAGLVDYLECLDGNEGVKQFLLTTLARQAEALAACQDEGGLWHTLLDDKSSYLETSASCAFAYGILKAVRMGYLPAKYAAVGEKAVEAVLGQIREDGTVEGVSYGTPVFETLKDYKEIPVCPMPYGQSMALMMLVEASKWGEQKKDMAG